MRVLPEQERRLFEFAHYFKSLFDLPLKHSTSLHVVGGQLDPAQFGLSGEHATLLNVAGRGLTQRQAFFSCVGEGVEHLSILEWPEDTLGRHEIVECQPDDLNEEIVRDWIRPWFGNGNYGKRPRLECVAFEAIDGSAPIYLPLEFAVRRPSLSRKSRLLSRSNGCAAGNTTSQATTSALLELIERDCFALWWFGGEQRAIIHGEVLKTLGIDQFVREDRSQSKRENWFLDLTSDLEIPCVAAISATSEGTCVAAGFGVDLDPTKAILKSLAELGQMEVALDLALEQSKSTPFECLSSQQKYYVVRSHEMTLELYTKLKPSTPATDFRDLVDGAHSRSDVIETLLNKGCGVYRLDLTREQVGIPVVRTAVPGLQSQSLDWVTPRLKKALKKNGRSLDAAAIDHTLF